MSMTSRAPRFKRAPLLIDGRDAADRAAAMVENRFGDVNGLPEAGEAG
jgi:hypothetical protein